KQLLNQLLEGAMAAGGGQSSDVVGAMIRDARGLVLAHRGAGIKDLPLRAAAQLEEKDAVTDAGDEVILFRAPVTTRAAGPGGDVAAELGLAAPAGAARVVEDQKGGVEVAISKKVTAEQQRDILLRTVLVGLLLFALGSIGGWYLTGKWVSPVQYMAEMASAVAKGNLTQSVKFDTGDEIGNLAESLNEMVVNLRRIVDNIQETSVQVASSAGQISANAKLITQGAQSQAMAAEETSTSMEEMAASIQTVAGNAQSLATHVEETSSSITQMSSSIEQVAKSSSTLAGTVTEASATIEEMTVSIDQMAKNLENLAGTVTETSSTIEEMATSIEGVAKNAETLTTAAQKASQRVTEMAAAVNDVAKIAEEADRISSKASEDARLGDVAVATTVEGMKNISETMENTTRVITSLGKRSQEIGKILEVIEE